MSESNEVVENKQQAFKSHSIGALCDSYMEVVVPKDASDTQRLETKRAFYAGAKSTFDLMGAVSDRFPEDIAMKILDGIYEEFEAFNKEQCGQ